MLLSMEEIATAHLLARDDIQARVVSETPEDMEGAWVTVTQMDPQDQSPQIGDYFVNYMLQFDCYASREGGKDEADVLTRTVRQALRDMRWGVEGAIVSDVRFGSCPYLPDAGAGEPARPRYSLTAGIYAHPTNA